jgi:hypothetical protein
MNLVFNLILFFIFFQMIRRNLSLLKQTVLLRKKDRIDRTLKHKLGRGSRKGRVS